MSNLASRLTQLERNRPPQGNRVVVIYEDQHTPEEIAAMGEDKTIGTLIVIQYASVAGPVSMIEHKQNGALQRVGVDVGEI